MFAMIYTEKKFAMIFLKNLQEHKRLCMGLDCDIFVVTFIF